MPNTPKPVEKPSSLWGDMHQRGIACGIEYHVLKHQKSLLDLEKKARKTRAKIEELERMLNTELLPQIEIAKVRIIF